MSRSKFRPNVHPRRANPLDDWRPRIARALVREELEDGLREIEDVPDGDHASEHAQVMAVVDAKTRWHRGRRRSWVERKFEQAWRRRCVLAHVFGFCGPDTDAADARWRRTVRRGLQGELRGNAGRRRAAIMWRNAGNGSDPAAK